MGGDEHQKNGLDVSDLVPSGVLNFGGNPPIRCCGYHAPQGLQRDGYLQFCAFHPPPFFSHMFTCLFPRSSCPPPLLLGLSPPTRDVGRPVLISVCSTWKKLEQMNVIQSHDPIPNMSSASCQPPSCQRSWLFPVLSATPIYGEMDTRYFRQIYQYEKPVACVTCYLQSFNPREIARLCQLTLTLHLWGLSLDRQKHCAPGFLLSKKACHIFTLCLAIFPQLPQCLIISGFFLSISMPEYCECIAHFLFLSWFLHYCQQKGLDLHVVSLWTDKTAGKNSKKRRQTTDLVFKLDHDSKDKRGNAGNQGYLWPPMWRRSAENPNPPSITCLELQSVRTTSRAIILNFRVLHFQVRASNFMSSTLLSWFHWSSPILPTRPCNALTRMLGRMLSEKHPHWPVGTASPLRLNSMTM